MAPQISFTLHDDLPPIEAGIVDAGLGASNSAAAPLHDVRPLSCFARSGDGLARNTVIGGAIGRTWGRCCELQQLWVDTAHRRQGLGARLVQAFEQRAMQRGCQTFYLETFSFQAPALYRALGYRVHAEIDGFAPGITKYLMIRELPRTASLETP